MDDRPSIGGGQGSGKGIIKEWVDSKHVWYQEEIRC